MTWLDDMIIGAELVLGTHHFVESEMVAFAKIYDPRYDPRPENRGEYSGEYSEHNKMAKAPLGDRVASPWYVTAIWMRMMINARSKNIFDHMSKPAKDKDDALIGTSPGFLDMSFPNLVKAGDDITYKVRVHELIHLKSRPQWGIARNLNEGYNQKGQKVMRFFGQVLMERRRK